MSSSPLVAGNVLSVEDARLLVASVQDYAIFMLDPSGCVSSWNLGAERLYGYRAEEIIGRHFSSLYPAEEAEAGLPGRELEDAIAHGRIEREGLRVRKDGGRFWCNVVLTALHDPAGKLRGFAKVVRDVTTQRAAEEALRRTEERFRLLVESVEDYAIYMLDPQGVVTTWNVGAERIKGYSADEIVGQSFSRFFPEEDVRAGKPWKELDLARKQGRYAEQATRVRKDGSTFPASVVVTPVRDGKGVLIGFAKVTRDLSALVQAELTSRELAREQAARAAAQAAEARIRDSEERYRMLSQRLNAILEGVGDGIMVQEASGRLIFANTAGARASGFDSAEELVRAGPEQVAERFEMTDESGARVQRSSLPGARALAGESPCSQLLHVHNRVTGDRSWSLVRANAIAGADGRPELAITIWHDVSEERRRELHEKYLVDATAALSESLDYGMMLSTLAGLLVPGLADWCVIHLLEQERLEPVALAHVDAAKVSLAREIERRYPPALDAPRGVWNVIRTGQPELVTEISDELLEAAAQDEAHLAILRGVGMRSVIIVPVHTRDRVLGTVSLASAESGRRYDAQDLALARELGRRAGSAVENAQLYQAEKKARDQVALLARAGEAFASASDYEETLRSVVLSPLPMLADFAFFDILEEGRVRRIGAAHAEAGEQSLTERLAILPAPRSAAYVSALDSGEAAIYPEVDEALRRQLAVRPEDLALLESLQLCSIVTVPLRGRDQVMGALTLCYGKSGRHHNQDDLELAEELARRAAAAVVQVQLYKEAQTAALLAAQAAERAEQANRVKDEFLATVSHELRTPLNAILGWAAVLRERLADNALARGAEVIHRNSLAQRKIIEDILDVSRIITGKLRLDPKSADLTSIARESIEIVRPSAAAKHLTIQFEPSDQAQLVADPERLQQVLWNLLSNAVKFSEPGGTISVSVQRESTHLVLTVTDTGRGIDPEFLPFVFDRFKQADSSTTRRFGGLGLGLSIVRHLVELHGGQVEAHSLGLGQGASFVVTLPVRQLALGHAPKDDSQPPQASQPVPARGASRLRGKRILVVDDELDARELVRAVLSEHGAQVDTAGSADEAVAALGRGMPDALICDIGMPGEDGYSLLSRIRRLDPAYAHIPALALTAYTRPEDRAKALGVGFRSHLGKPAEPSEVVAAVEQLLVEDAPA